MKLYRGVNCDMYSKIRDDEYIKPKARTFEAVLRYDGSIKLDGSATFGKTFQNAIIGHQFDSGIYMTSGISTTPDFGRAENYALNNGKYAIGYVFVFDTEILNMDDYELLKVSEFVKSPTKPHDEEIILKRKDNKVIPLEIVVDIICVNSLSSI